MSAVDLANLTELAAAWGIRPTRAALLRDGVYRVETQRGPYCLKRVRQSPGVVKFIQDALDHLDAQGFHRISRFIPTANGLSGLAKAGCTWVLVEWILGRSPDVTDREDLRQSALTLAQFHRAARGFRPRSGSIPQDFLGTWPATFQQVQHGIRRATSEAFLEAHAFLAGPLSANADWLCRQTDKALGLLAGSEYRRLIAARRAEKGFCHGDSGGGNFVIAPDGRALLIDFETLRYELRVYDLFRLIRRSLKRNGWRADTASWIMESYGRENPVAAAELPLLLACLYLPIKFNRLISRCTVLADGPERDVALLKLNKYLGRREEIDRFLNDFGRYLGVGA